MSLFFIIALQFFSRWRGQRVLTESTRLNIKREDLRPNTNNTVVPLEVEQIQKERERHTTT